MKYSKFLKLNSFILKIIAIFTMTLDHIGMYLIGFANNTITNPMGMTGYVFRCVGRIALPIFCVAVVEAMIHSTNKKKYLYRLSIMAALLIFVPLIVNYILPFSFKIKGENIFLELLCGASFIYFYEKKDYKKLFMLIPLALVITCFIISIKEKEGYTITWLPQFLRCEYNLYGFLLILGFYFSYSLSDLYIKNYIEESGIENVTIIDLKKSNKYRMFTNLMWFFALGLVTFLFWVLSYVNPSLDMFNMDIQEWAIISAIPLLMYNGLKGYSNKYIKYGFYVYYPLHLIIIVLGFYLGFGYWIK